MPSQHIICSNVYGVRKSCFWFGKRFCKFKQNAKNVEYKKVLDRDSQNDNKRKMATYLQNICTVIVPFFRQCQIQTGFFLSRFRKFHSIK